MPSIDYSWNLSSRLPQERKELVELKAAALKRPKEVAKATMAVEKVTEEAGVTGGEVRWYMVSEL